MTLYWINMQAFWKHFLLQLKKKKMNKYHMKCENVTFPSTPPCTLFSWGNDMQCAHRICKSHIPEGLLVINQVGEGQDKQHIIMRPRRRRLNLKEPASLSMSQDGSVGPSGVCWQRDVSGTMLDSVSGWASKLWLQHHLVSGGIEKKMAGGLGMDKQGLSALYFLWGM